MTSKLEQLKQFTTVVCDTGDLEAISRLKPVDATTNPSLLLKASAIAHYGDILRNSVDLSKGDLGLACDQFSVAVGCGILKAIPGRISTEVDARLSFDEDATYTRAERLIELYQAAGVVISPLTFGSGLKIKLIEALAAGKAIVATPVTLQGVERECADAVACTDDPAAFAAQVLALRDDDLRARQAAAALTAARAHFSPAACYRNFQEWLTTSLSPPSTPAPTAPAS